MAGRESLFYAIDYAKLVGMDRELLMFSQLESDKQSDKLQEVYARVKDKPDAKEIIDLYQGVMEATAAQRTRNRKGQNRAIARIHGAVERILEQTKTRGR